MIPVLVIETKCSCTRVVEVLLFNSPYIFEDQKNEALDDHSVERTVRRLDD